MSVHDVRFDGAVNWRSNGLSEVPFRVYTDPQQYAIEQETIFKGETWSYLCLAGEVPNPGDWVATTVGEVAVIVTRDEAGAINAFVNRCAHRGNLLCLRNRGHDREITCIYHGWSYDLTGQLIGAAGYISMEDGCVGGFVQRALQYNDEGDGVVMMGGHEAQSQNFRASEAAIRGFWKKYRALTGI